MTDELVAAIKEFLDDRNVNESQPTPNALAQEQVFRNRLAKVARHLRRWPSRGISCYRIYDHDVPDVPLVIDRYGDKLYIAEYGQRHDRSPEGHRAWLDRMVSTAADVLGVAEGNVYEKRRERQGRFSQYEKTGDERRVFTVEEGGLKFLVNLSDYIDTGLFLDHRITRSMVREAAAGRRFLNLFAYTGSFTVYAAAGGAASTTTVDLSNTYLDWARRNLDLNGLAGPAHSEHITVRTKADPVFSASLGHRFVRSDAMAFLTDHAPGAAYDLAVVDPPTFSRSKAASDFDIARHHPTLLNRLVRLMSPGGTIFFSTNFREFRLAEGEIRNVEIREISRQTVPPDFRDRKIHRSWRLVVKGGAG